MKVLVEELSPVERKLSIEVESAMVTQELDKAYAALSRTVKVAGFRQGKVPRRILEQHYKTEVEGDVVQRVVQRAYFDAIREHSIEAVGVPRVTPEKLVTDSPFSFVAQVEVKPKVVAKDYKGLSLQRAPVKVEEKDIDARIEQLRENMSQLQEVEGRQVAELGDFAIVDYFATSEGKDFPGNKGSDVTMEVTPGELVEGNAAGLAGLKIGEKKTVDYFFPETYRVESLRKKPAQFEFTLKVLKKKIVPELNDEFAKNSRNDVESLQALKDKIRQGLERAQQRKAENEEREALIRALVEKNAFDVPTSMVDRTIDVMLESAFESMYRSGLNPNQLQMDLGALRAEIRPKAELEVRGGLLFEAIALQEKIEATEADEEKEFAELAAETEQPVSNIRKHFASEDKKRSLSLRLREKKTLEFLKSQARNS